MRRSHSRSPSPTRKRSIFDRLDPVQDISDDDDERSPSKKQNWYFDRNGRRDREPQQQQQRRFSSQNAQLSTPSVYPAPANEIGVCVPNNCYFNSVELPFDDINACATCSQSMRRRFSCDAFCFHHFFSNDGCRYGKNCHYRHDVLVSSNEKGKKVKIRLNTLGNPKSSAITTAAQIVGPCDLMTDIRRGGSTSFVVQLAPEDALAIRQRVTMPVVAMRNFTLVLDNLFWATYQKNISSV